MHEESAEARVLRHFKVSRFTEHIISGNFPRGKGFREWVFLPGMLFRSSVKWWGGAGSRETPHEGLDLRTFRDMKDEVHVFGAGARIPAMYDGTVAGFMDDFLGKTVIVEHGPVDKGGSCFCTMYAHTFPLKHVHAGMTVHAGDVIATIAGTAGTKGGIAPHLHISLGLLPEKGSCVQFGWRNMWEAKGLTLIDPLKFIGGKYSIA